MRNPLEVRTLGYLVPRTAFTGRVHSVFEQSCNLECGVAHGLGLLTLCGRDTSVGPTTLHLASDATADLRKLFCVGELLRCSENLLRIGQVEVCLRRAAVWKPCGSSPSSAHRELSAAHCRRASALLAKARLSRPSVIDAAAAPVVAALASACRGLDVQVAQAQALRLVGWGEGLTPAGDDYLVGLLAALHAAAPGDASRGSFHAALAAQIASNAVRTTPIAAHYLLLAAAGHFTEPLLNLRDALLAQADDARLDAALQRALAVGATSGADTVAGLLAGLTAWNSPCAASTIAL